MDGPYNASTILKRPRATERGGMSDGNPGQGQAPDPAQVVQAEMVVPRPPRPGFWLSVGCCLLMLGTQIGVVVAVVLAWVALTAIRSGKPPDPATLEESLPMTLLIGAGTVGTLLSALLMVAIAYRRQALRNAAAIQWVAAA